jgi:hypothetical protein
VLSVQALQPLQLLLSSVDCNTGSLGGIQGYQAFVGDLRGAGALEWPLRILLVIGGFVVATPGGGIMPLSQMQVTLLGLAILVPTIAIALLLVRRQALIPNQLRAP